MQINKQQKLYLIADANSCTHFKVEEVIIKAIKSGVNIVQLRNKNNPQEMLQLGKCIQPILRNYNIPLIINDNVEIAIALNADGVHIGQTDTPYAKVRAMLGYNKIIGLSVTNQEQTIAAEQLDVNYLGVGPIFATQTKKDASPALGITELQTICNSSSHYIYAIGGINATNAKNVMATGVNGIAVAAAICTATNPQAACKQILSELI